MSLNRVLGPDFVGPREIDEIDDEYVHTVLDKLELSSTKGPNPFEAQTLATATALLARSDDMAGELAKYPHMRLLLDMDFFNPERSPHMITSSEEVREMLARSTPVREAFKRYKEDGPNRTDDEWRVILTAWNVLFDQISHRTKLGQQSVA